MEFENKVHGCPGSSIDEGKLPDGSPCLIFSCFNDEGTLVYAKTFPIDATPLEIAESLEQSVEDVYDNPPCGLSLEEISDLLDELGKQVERVPGLRS